MLLALKLKRGCIHVIPSKDLRARTEWMNLGWDVLIFRGSSVMNPPVNQIESLFNAVLGGALYLLCLYTDVALLGTKTAAMTTTWGVMILLNLA